MRMKFNKTSQLLLVSAASLLAAGLMTACGTDTVDFVYVASSQAAGTNNYGEIDVFCIPGRNVVDHLAERGVIDLERTAVARIHPRTVDQHPLGLLQETCGMRCRLDGGDHDVSPMLEDSLADAHQARREGVALGLHGRDLVFDCLQGSGRSRGA